MIPYIRCPTCGRVISFNLGKYQKELQNLLQDPTMNTQQKEKAGAELLNKYGFKHICCRIRIMGLIFYHQIICS